MLKKFTKKDKLSDQICSEYNNQGINIIESNCSNILTSARPDCVELNMFNNKILHDVKFVSNVRDTI